MPGIVNKYSCRPIFAGDGGAALGLIKDMGQISNSYVSPLSAT